MRVRALLAALLLGTAATAPAGSATLTLIYSGNLNGEIEPCGCTRETDYGGILRRATALERLRSETDTPPVVLTTGGLLSTFAADDEVKNTFILTGTARLKYDVVGVQWTDFTHGVDFLTSKGLPLVASNWRDGAIPSSRSVRRGDVELRVFQWLDPAESPYREMKGAHSPVTEDTQGLAAALAAAKAEGAITLLATTLPPPAAESLAPLEHVDVLLVQAKPDQPGEPRQVGGTLVLQPGTRGMRLGRADLKIQEGRLAGWSHAVLELDDKVADSTGLQAWYADYNAQVRADYQRRVAERKARKSGASPYAGAETCAACHATADRSWRESRHAHAFATLEGVGKSFDPNCIVCHTVAFGQDGGYLDTALTGHLSNVQCESCHGGARAHVQSEGTTPTAYADRGVGTVCGQCHNASHSPSFEFGAYWPKVVHGRDPESTARRE